MRLARVIVLLAAVAGPAACGAEDDASRARLLRAADATRDAGGARFEAKGDVAVGIDRTYRFTGTGLRDARGATDATRRYSDVPSDYRTVRTIVIGDTTYLTYPGGGPFGKKWLSVERANTSPRLLAGPDPADPGAIARQLDSGEVREVGRARVRGITTTHYAATVDLRDFTRFVSPDGFAAVRRAHVRALQQGGGGSLLIDLWVDDHDLIRRVRQRLTTRLTGVDYPPDDQAIELFDFGQARRVVPPPKRDTEVLDAARSE